MRVVILAGGKGTRLGSITENIAKPMVEVGGKPTLEHIVMWFKNYGITEFTFALCYLPNSITSYFGDGNRFGINIVYTFEKENEPLGTAGAVLMSKKYVNEDFIVTCGDAFRNIDINKVVYEHKLKGTLATIGLFRDYSEHPRSKVIVDENCFVLNFIEHPLESNCHGSFMWSNDSFYVFKPKIFDYIPEGVFVDFGKYVFPGLIKDGKNINTFVNENEVIDVGTLDGLEKARELFKK